MYTVLQLYPGTVYRQPSTYVQIVHIQYLALSLPVHDVYVAPLRVKRNPWRQKTQCGRHLFGGLSHGIL